MCNKYHPLYFYHSPQLNCLVVFCKKWATASFCARVVRSDAYGSIFLTDGDRPNYPMHTHTHLALTYDISPSSQKIIVYSTLNSIPMHTLFILPVCKRSKQRINFGRDVAFCRPNVASLRCFLFFFHLSFGYSSSCRSNPIRLHSRARFCLQTPFLHSPLFLFLYLLVQARSTRPLNDWLRIYFEDLIKKNRDTFKEGDEHQPFFFHEQNLMTKGRRESIPIIVYLPTPFVCNTIFLLVRVSLFFFHSAKTRLAFTTLLDWTM